MLTNQIGKTCNEGIYITPLLFTEPRDTSQSGLFLKFKGMSFKWFLASCLIAFREEFKRFMSLV